MQVLNPLEVLLQSWGIKHTRHFLFMRLLLYGDSVFFYHFFVGHNLNSPVHNLVHPRDAFTARRALSARLVLVEHNETSDSFHNVSRFVHHDDSCCTQGCLACDQTVEVHYGCVAHTVNLM